MAEENMGQKYLLSSACKSRVTGMEESELTYDTAESDLWLCKVT